MVTAIAALLFAVHPSHVGAVAWVSGATDSLMAALLLGSPLLYLKTSQFRKYDESMAVGIFGPGRTRHAHQETALILAVIIFSYQWIYPQNGASGKRRLFSATHAALPYAVIALVFIIARTLALGSVTPSTRAGLRSSIAAWPQVLTFYSAHALFPFHLSVFYDLISVTHLGFWNFFAPLTLVLPAAVALCYVSFRSRLWAFLSAWCAIMLIPMLNVTFGTESRTSMTAIYFAVRRDLRDAGDWIVAAEPI